MQFCGNANVSSGDFVIDIAVADHEVDGDRAVSISFGGWVATPLGDPDEILLLLDGCTVGRASVEFERPDVLEARQDLSFVRLRCGFSLRLSKLILTQGCSLEVAVDVRTGNESLQTFVVGTIGPLGAFRLETHYKERVSPLLVTGMGRSGTSYLMALLKCHPEIAAPGRAPFETRQLTYLWHALTIMTGPANYKYSMFPDSFEKANEYHIGCNPFMHLSFERGEEGAGVAMFQEEILPGMMIDALKRLGDRFVGALQPSRGASAPPKYVAEKTVISPVRRLVRNIYSRSREIFLVRDFRDMWVSARQFNSRRKTQSFGRERFMSDEDWMCGLSTSIGQFQRAYESAKLEACLIYYEDLVVSPETALQKIFNYLGIDDSPIQVDKIVREVETKVMAGGVAHRTGDLKNPFVARWPAEMTQEMKALTKELWGPQLRYFGYALDAA